MAAASSVVDVQKLTGQFDVSSVRTFNLINVGRYIVNNLENTFNFCCEPNLSRNSHSCQHCRQQLKLSVDRQTITPRRLFFVAQTEVARSNIFLFVTDRYLMILSCRWNRLSC